MLNLKKCCFFYLFLLSIFLPITAYTAVPRIFNYVGVLIDQTTKVPIPDGEYSITFSISGSSWSETHTLQVKNGVFGVLLGGKIVLPSDIDLQNEKQLQISVTGQTAISIKIPAALYAINADTLDGKHASELVTKIIAGSNISISPETGTGEVTISATATGTGNIISLTPGTGLTGGGTSGNVTLSIADGGVGITQLADGAVTSAKIATDALSSAQVTNSAITSEKIADGAITTAKINSGAIGTIQIADGTITSAKIASGTLITTHITDSAITTAKIADGTITDSDISSSASISQNKLSLAITDSEIAAGANISASKINTSGLNADTVDGYHATNFATATHNHDLDYVNVTGDIMSGNLAVNGTVTASSFIGDGAGLTGVATTSHWLNTTGGIYYNSGNVGIGVASPSAKLDVAGSLKMTGDLVDSSGNIIYDATTTKIPQERLPFNKGDLLAPEDRPLVSGLSQYLTGYFNISGLGLSGASASNVKQGVTFGPGGGLTGTLVTGSSQTTYGSLTIENGESRDCCASPSGGACTTVLYFPSATCPSDKPYTINSCVGRARGRITCPSGNVGVAYGVERGGWYQGAADVRWLWLNGSTTVYTEIYAACGNNPYELDVPQGSPICVQ